MKYRDLVREAMNCLNEIGITPLFPNITLQKENLTIEEKKCLALEHYEAIDESDVVYFIVPDGYMGTSCKIELGYSVAKNKTIYFSEPTNDIGLDCYVKDFISLKDLRKFLLV